MTVHCPNCSTGYSLPDHLMGPRGSRVRCPQCSAVFVVMREEAPPAEPAAPPAEPDSESVAAEILDALAARLGPRIDVARARRRVLSELGPDLLRAWDEYRGRLGDRASSEVFRSVLRERWDVTLG